LRTDSQVGNGFEDATPDAPAGDDGEEVLDGVEPRGRDRGEMENPARMVGQPFQDLGVLVGGVVVGNGVDELARWNGPLDGIQKLDELLVGMLGHAAPDNGAVQDVEGGKQGGGAIALVVMGHRAASAGLQGQAGLGAVKRLDLAFLVDGDDDGMGRRVHVEADDIADLGGELGVVGQLELAPAVGLQTMGAPDALHRTDADAMERVKGIEPSS